METSKAYFCPRCHSPAITYAVLGGKTDESHCDACGWRGTQGDLLLSSFKHSTGSEEQMLQAFVTDLRNLVAKECFLPYGRWLRKWGFIPDDPDEQRRLMTLYVIAIAKASVTAILQTRRDLEKARIDVS